MFIRSEENDEKYMLHLISNVILMIVEVKDNHTLSL